MKETLVKCVGFRIAQPNGIRIFDRPTDRIDSHCGANAKRATLLTDRTLRWGVRGGASRPSAGGLGVGTPDPGSLSTSNLRPSTTPRIVAVSKIQQLLARSFRLRIALLSSVLAGVALVGFGSVSFWLIYQTELNRIDDAIKNQLLREADRPTPRKQWQEYFNSLASTFAIDTDSNLAMLVQDPQSQVVFRSPTWGEELTKSVAFVPQTAFPTRPADSMRPPIDRLRRRQLAPFFTRTTATGSWRVGAVTATPMRLAIAVNLSTLDREMAGIRNAFVVVIPLILVSIAIGAWWLAGRALAPVRELTANLRNVTVKGLDRRVPTDRTDLEFLELLQVFNQMMARLERSFAQASRFSADAAHELKTPLSILQGDLERTLQAAPEGSQLQQRLSGLLDEVRHLSAIVRKLLLLSLADAGQMRVHTVAVDLSALLNELAEDIELLAPDLDVRMQIDRSLIVNADLALLMQVLQNLISNATKYNLPNGWVNIAAKQHDRSIILTIANSSKDIPSDERERIFDRFYRGDPARNRHVEGLGLGLSLAREIVFAHNGNLTLDPTPIGQTAFTLTLPVRSNDVRSID
jgi:two-component system, OmpR family, heavy metal sensor histidine kinase CusS